MNFVFSKPCWPIRRPWWVGHVFVVNLVRFRFPFPSQDCQAICTQTFTTVTYIWTESCHWDLFDFFFSISYFALNNQNSKACHKYTNCNELCVSLLISIQNRTVNFSRKKRCHINSLFGSPHYDQVDFLHCWLCMRVNADFVAGIVWTKSTSGNPGWQAPRWNIGCIFVHFCKLTINRRASLLQWLKPRDNKNAQLLCRANVNMVLKNFYLSPMITRFATRNFFGSLLRAHFRCHRPYT